ncbi:MAG: UvrD-helicase domain-containing protein [Gemmatimonadaceae bacterium]
MSIASPASQPQQFDPAISHAASPSQRGAIEAPAQPLLVLAGPGAGKTFCLIERIRYLIDRLGFAPARICAFTFTNRAAGEIGSRLDRHLGSKSEGVNCGTIHAFCVRLLREFGEHVGLRPGFGIADEEYQLAALRRLQGHRRWHRAVLSRFSEHRFRGEVLLPDDDALFERYERFLAERNVLDFDQLVTKSVELLEGTPAAETIRARWDVLLVDEFQDLNPMQYRLIRELARDHRHVFAVGDHEQSIFSWAGADPKVFAAFLNDFGMASRVQLGENRRCPRDVFELACRLVGNNRPIFDDCVRVQASRESPFAVIALSCETDEAESEWMIADIKRDRAEQATRWGDIALLYRTHAVGEGIEAAFLNAGIPCRLAQGRALAEDPVVAHVIAALRVIANPDDDIHRDAFFAAVLTRSLFDDARARAQSEGSELQHHLNRMAADLPHGHEDKRRIRRAFYALLNLRALGQRHDNISSLIQDLLSQRVGPYRSVLQEHEDEITDPAANEEIVMLAERLRAARDEGRAISLPSMGGMEIPLEAMLSALGFREILRGGTPPPPPAADAEHLSNESVPSLGIALGLFKAAQLLETSDLATSFSDFTVIDLETTSNDAKGAEIVDIAAVRVRGGEIAEHFESLIRPRSAIPAVASEIHGIHDADVAGAPRFEEAWPRFRAFCGRDVVVAHNGYGFDFRILKRMVTAQEKPFELCTYDTLPLARDLVPTSRKLTDLAAAFGIDPGRSHRALDDAMTLARVFPRLENARLVRARKTAMVNLLGHLGIALALSEEQPLSPEAELFARISRPYALGRYSGALEFYESGSAGDESVCAVDELIERLGGAELMLRIRADRSAEDRYPAEMTRLQRLVDRIPGGSLASQIAAFLESVVLSKWDGAEPEEGRVNLLTLHSTKGLEFSRVYIAGAEDALMPGGPATRQATEAELEEARRLLYVGMTRTKDRLVLTRVESRAGRPTGGHRFLDEMGLVPVRSGGGGDGGGVGGVGGMGGVGGVGDGGGGSGDVGASDGHGAGGDEPLADQVDPEVQPL